MSGNTRRCRAMSDARANGGVITASDPVCRMTVAESAPAATSEYDGVTYCSCASGCKGVFDEDPERYLKSGEKHPRLSRLIPTRESRPGTDVGRSREVIATKRSRRALRIADRRRSPRRLRCNLSR